MADAWILAAGPALLVAAAAVGWGPAGRWLRDEHRARLDERLLFAGLAGVLLVYAWLWLGDLVGLPWTRATVLLFFVAGAVASVGLAAGRAPGTDRWLDASWRRDRWRPAGDAVALGAVAVFAVASALLWNLHPDFVLHWGVKGARFHLAGGIDWQYLARPWNHHVHPDYPNLLPSLFAAGAVVAGRFDAASCALGSAVFFVLLLLAARALPARAGAGPFAGFVGLGLVAWGAAGFGVGFRQAGGADLPMALAVTAGAALLIGPADRVADRRVAVVAAFAACSKLEGVVVAVLLLALHLARRRPRGAGAAVGVALRSGWPAALAVGLWALQTRRHGLFLDTNAGALDLDRLGVVLPGLWRALLTGPWHGLPFVLALLPWLALRPKSRWPAVLLLGQGAFYLWVYLSAPVDTALLVATSAPRLLFHLVPAALLLAVVELDRLAVLAPQHAEPAAEGV